MNPGTGVDLSEYSMVDLFRLEAENQMALLTQGLLELEKGGDVDERLEVLMRAAHSIKGAARMVGATSVVRVAHGMEDCFVAAQRGELRLQRRHVDALLKGVDTIALLAKLPDEMLADGGEHEKAVEALEAGYQAIRAEDGPPAGATAEAPESATARARAGQNRQRPASDAEAADLRISSARLARLTGLASEALVETRWLRPYLERMWQVKRRQFDMVDTLDRLGQALENTPLNAKAQDLFTSAYKNAMALRQQFADGLTELEAFDRRLAGVSGRIYQEVLASRMRPFADVVQGLPRMVRDMGRRLGKEVRLETTGLATQVDRDVLDKIIVPLKHLVQNAIDHGIETPAERQGQAKPGAATISVAATHSGGMLLLTVADDGRGIDLEVLRAAVVERAVASAPMAAGLGEAELLNFLFLPGFTTRSAVTELSGRGVGLDVVHEAVRSLHGTVRVTTSAGRGTQFQLQLPLTLSVIRALLVEIGAESFAFPLARIDRILKIPRVQFETLYGNLAIEVDGYAINVAAATRIFDLPQEPRRGEELHIVIFSDRTARYGVIVDRFLGERDLAVQPLDAQLGKIRHISAAAQLEDGSPTLIVDIDDLISSVDDLHYRDEIPPVAEEVAAVRAVKRILVVEDSITVREGVRNMLQTQGYAVDVAVDGVDGWNALRGTDYDLVVTDVDMPRMDGIELLGLIRNDAKRRSLPVVILSYKGRAEDRRRGLDAGADYYLSKGEVDEARLVEAVGDLIGGPQS